MADEAVAVAVAVALAAAHRRVIAVRHRPLLAVGRASHTPSNDTELSCEPAISFHYIESKNIMYVDALVGHSCRLVWCSDRMRRVCEGQYATTPGVHGHGRIHGQTLSHYVTSTKRIVTICIYANIVYHRIYHMFIEYYNLLNIH